MTLEEARKEIQAHVNEQWEEFEKTGSLFCQGCAFGGNAALAILNEVDSEPVGKDKMTLTELAHELRKLFNFRWLTYDRRGDDWYVINLWKSKPVYEIGMWCPKRDIESDYPQSINRLFLKPEIELDLSEYPDTYGQIDYSKCIVEVE